LLIHRKFLAFLTPCYSAGIGSNPSWSWSVCLELEGVWSTCLSESNSKSSVYPTWIELFCHMCKCMFADWRKREKIGGWREELPKGGLWGKQTSCSANNVM